MSTMIKKMIVSISILWTLLQDASGPGRSTKVWNDYQQVIVSVVVMIVVVFFIPNMKMVILMIMVVLAR